jgi:hypothetical protein
MKLPADPRLPTGEANMRQRLTDLMRDVAQQVNGVSEGKLAATYNAQTAAPTTGTHALGDFVRNSAPAELGSASSKYVILGWVCVTAGTPGTWVQARALTGN